VLLNENKNIWPVFGVIILGVALLLGGIYWVVNNASFKVGSVDLDKIAKNSMISKRINQELQSKGIELQEQMKSAKTETDKNKIRSEFESFQADKQREFVDKIKQIVATVAKRKGIKAVSNPQVFVYSGIDLTDEVIKELDK
jgi:Skp family chaperone for outer membrane proteins